MSLTMPQIVAIGNAPSSGSSLLADLFDSLPAAVCGPEIQLFSPSVHFEDYARLQTEGFISAPCGAPYVNRKQFGVNRLDAYGLDEAQALCFLKEAPTFVDFCHRFFAHFTQFREKSAALFLEKTPENIHTAGQFLQTFPEGYFLHIVRDPLYVTKSLRRRGHSAYLAAATWIIDVSAAYKLRNHPRFIDIRYQDLVEKPFALVTELAQQFGHPPLKPGELEAAYQENQYRQEHSHKIKTWSITDYGRIGNANQTPIDAEDRQAIALMRRLMVNPAYAAQFDLPHITFEQLAAYYGYTYDIPPAPYYRPLPATDEDTIQRLYIKYKKDAAHVADEDFSKQAVINLYLNPVIDRLPWRIFFNNKRKEDAQ